MLKNPPSPQYELEMISLEQFVPKLQHWYKISGKSPLWYWHFCVVYGSNYAHQGHL